MYGQGLTVLYEQYLRMKAFLRTIITSILCIPLVFADVDTLQIDAPENAEINEAIDFTLRAVDAG